MLLKVPTIITWIICAIRVRYYFHKLIFSKRNEFMDELRPKVDAGRILYPDAIMLITNKDVNRAIKAIRNKKRGITNKGLTA